MTIPINYSYVAWANSLDSTGTDSTEARKRLKDRHTLERIFDNMQHIIEVGATADQIKKWVFYGKPIDGEGLYFPYKVTNPAIGVFDNHDVVRIFHAVLGLVTEASELMEMLKGHIYEDKPLDVLNLIEEAGDQCWYLALIAKSVGFDTFDEFMLSNRAKLTARYGDSWSQDAALTRNTANEMDVLADSIDKGQEENQNAEILRDSVPVEEKHTTD